MSLRIFMAGAMLASLGGCEGGSPRAANDRDGSNMAVSSPNASESDRVAAGGPPVMGASPALPRARTDCTHLPDFVPLYGDARVETCVSGPGEPGHESGTVIYTTGALPAVILTWYRDKAKVVGLTEALSTPTLFSAREDGKRSITAMVETVKGATKVTVNWGRDI